MNKILIITQNQFGYIIDHYKWAIYLKQIYSVTLNCWDYGRKKIYQDGVCVNYKLRKGNKIRRLIEFNIEQLYHLKNNYNTVIIKYYFGCSLLNLTRKKNIILDIRTGCVSKNRYNRYFQNAFLRIESFFFPNIIVISNSLAQVLRIANYHIVPLGGDLIERERKQETFRLLYVGILSSRNIEITIMGVNEFIKRNEYYRDKVFYTIIGSGFGNEEQKLTALVISLGLSDNISLKGYISHGQIKEYFQKSDIGIAFIPIEERYNFQPATKTYEYLLAGMPVLATKTHENKKIITEDNGVLIEDTVQSFEKGLSTIIENYESYDSEKIKRSKDCSTWDKIVTDSLIPFIKSTSEDISFICKTKTD